MTSPRTYLRRSTGSLHFPRIWAVIILTLLLAIVVVPYSSGFLFAATKPTRSQSAVTLRKVAQGSNGGYVGSAACAECHADIYRSFLRTRMGRSLAPVTAETIRALPLPGDFYNATLDRHFRVSRSQGTLVESEYQTGPGGEEIFRNTQPMGWKIGAGLNGYGFLLRRGDYLFEAPLSYFTSAKAWQMSPGYENQDNGFSRPVLAGCISCHSGRPNPADADTGKFASKPFTQTAIGCENCHGPGAAHVSAMKLGGEKRDFKIVNPNKLTASLENDICMSCHEAGDVRVPKPGKTYQDFRPGTPLDGTLSIFMAPFKPSDAESVDHVQHYFEMSMSKCFRGTSGELRCATCHDPHFEPTKAEAPKFFNQRCMACHTSASCKLPMEAREKTSPGDNCIGCHMPMRAQTGMAHTSLTNHRILARPGEPWPDAAFAQTTPALPDLVHLNRVAGHEDNLPLLSLLEAYRELSETRPEYKPAYEKTLSELEQTDPDHEEVQEALGRRDMGAGEFSEAIPHFQRATAFNPTRAQPYSNLAQALSRVGQLEDAVTASRKAVTLDPYKALYQKVLIDCLIAAKRYDEATAAMENYVKLFPEDSLMRKMLDLAKQ